VPSPKNGESQSDFISRCMSSNESQNSFPDTKQRSAFCNSQWKNKGKSSGETFVYKDPKTRELYHYDRRGVYKKEGRILVFVRKTEGDSMKPKPHWTPGARDFIKDADTFLQENKADEDAGYPPNCKLGYVEKDGRCVPAEESAEWSYEDNQKNEKD